MNRGVGPVVSAGLATLAVADGRVFVTDFERTHRRSLRTCGTRRWQTCFKQC